MKLVLGIFSIIFAVYILSIQAQDFFYDENGVSYIIDDFGNRYYTTADRFKQPKIKPADRKILKFAVNLFKSIDKYGQNFVVAPLSPQILLSALAKQSRGETKSEITDVTGFADSATLEELMSNMQKEPTNRELLFGNGFFIDSNQYSEIKPSFWSDKDRKHRQIDVIKTEFDRKEKVKRMYQSWVKRKTKDIISHADADFDQDTKILLASTIYFKGQWLFDFNRTEKGDFYLNRNERVQVDVMKVRKKFHSGDFDNINARWASIPYNSTEAMIIIMPNDGEKLDNVIESLTGDDVQDIIEVITGPQTINFVNVSLPKFTLKSSIELREPLSKMGINKLFTPRSELFIFNDNVPLRIGSGIQQSLLEVNEEGSMAAGVTSFSAVALTVQPQIKNSDFIVDRPFIAIIVDRLQSVPYFMAKVVDPRQNVF